MGKTIKIVLIITMAVTLFACSIQQKKPGVDASLKSEKPENAGTVLTFKESSAEEPERIARVIITDKFIRMDDGKGSKDFLLFNRAEKLIYNVVADEDFVMVMGRAKHVTINVAPLQWQVKSQTSHALMRSHLKDQTSAKHHKLILNGNACYNIVALENILQEESQALAEYHEVLARELKSSYTAHKDAQCFDAIHILEPKKRFAYGFPYREWSAYGYQRFLVNYQQKIIFPAVLFELPKK